MKKNIYRVIFASVCVLYFFWFTLLENLLGIISLLLLPFIFMFYFLIGLITGQPSNPFGGVSPINQLIVNIAFLSAGLGVVYCFVLLWVKEELTEKANNYLPVAQRAVHAFFFLALVYSTSSATHYQWGKIKEYSHQTELTSVNTNTLRIENYQEEPFHEWNSPGPIGMRVKFDLVGAGQKDHLLTTLNYSLQGSGDINLYAQCIPDDPAMEEQKKNAKIENHRSYLYLLMHPDRNHLIYKCYSPLFLKLYTDQYAYLCPHKNAEALLSNLPAYIEKKLNMSIVGAESGAMEKGLNEILQRDIPKKSLLYSADFWLRGDLQYNKISLPKGGTICIPPHYAETPKECICLKEAKK